MRELLKSLLGAAVLASAIHLWAIVPIPDEYRIGGYAIGCQAYSFNHYTAFEAIEKTAAAGGKIIEFYPGQPFSPEEPNIKVDQNLPDDYIAKLKQQLDKYHVRAVNFGVVGLPNDEAACRKVFEFAKKMGLRAVTSEPSPDAMDLIERLVKEYDIGMGIHNHPRRPNDPSYKFWDPHYVLSLVKGRDPRLGSCSDIGHFVRSGIKPADALRLLKGRIISMHIKDLNEFGLDAHDVPFGTGVSDIPAVLDELKRQGFQGNLSIEYEYHWTTSAPEIAQSIGFVRGYTAKRGSRATETARVTRVAE